jgi:hypothetical protein
MFIIICDMYICDMYVSCLLQSVPVQAGDVLLMEADMIHAGPAVSSDNVPRSTAFCAIYRDADGDPKEIDEQYHMIRLAQVLKCSDKKINSVINRYGAVFPDIAYGSNTSMPAIAEYDIAEQKSDEDKKPVVHPLPEDKYYKGGDVDENGWSKLLAAQGCTEESYYNGEHYPSTDSSERERNERKRKNRREARARKKERERTGITRPKEMRAQYGYNNNNNNNNSSNNSSNNYYNNNNNNSSSSNNNNNNNNNSSSNYYRRRDDDNDNDRRGRYDDDNNNDRRYSRGRYYR